MFRFQQLLSLFFPNLCACCRTELVANEQHICLSCLSAIPFTHYEKHPQNNPIFDRFVGKFPIQGATAIFHFDKGGKLQKALHHLKYKHKPKIGYILGKMGQEGLDSMQIPTNAVLIPVPLHKNKEKQRGYNQSLEICNGLAKGRVVDTKLIKRVQNTSTQTKKNKEERYQNVNQAFELTTSTLPSSIVLVDDVVTTGATLESIARTLLKKQAETKIWIVALAHARL